MVQQLSTIRFHRWPWAIAALALVGVSAAGWYGLQYSGAIAEPEEPALTVSPRTTITALGRLEPQGDIVQVNAPTSAQETRLAELRVQPGDTVVVGQVIAVLDARDRLTALVTQAESDVQVAQAELAQVRAGAKTGEIQAQTAEIDRIKADRQAQIRAQQANVARQAAEVANARTEAQRYQRLYEQGAISESERDSKNLVLTTAEQNLAQTQAELSRLQSTQTPELNRAQATLNQIAQVRPVDVQVAQAQVTRAQAALQKAQADLEQVYVRSPQAGVILEVYTRAGEVISSDGIAEIGHVSQMMAIAEVYQSDVQAVTTGQMAKITSPALPQTLQGTVERVGAKVQRQDVVNTDPSSNIDARVVEVTVRLDEPSSAIAAQFTNLQVQVEIER